MARYANWQSDEVQTFVIVWYPCQDPHLDGSASLRISIHEIRGADDGQAIAS